MAERFTPVLVRFRDELASTFPELKPQLDAMSSLSPSDTLDQVYAALHPHRTAISARDAAWISHEETHVLPGVSLSAVWNAADVTDTIRDTIWQYVRTLYCAAAEMKQEAPDSGFAEFLKECLLGATGPDSADSADSADSPDSAAGTEGSGGSEGAAAATATAAGVWRDYAAQFEQMLKKLEVDLPQDEESTAEMNAAFRALWHKVMTTQFGAIISRLMREFTPRDLGLDTDSWEAVMETHMAVDDMFEKIKRAYTTDAAAMEGRIARIKDMFTIMVRNKELQPERMADDLKMLIEEVKRLPCVERWLDEYSDTIEQFTQMIDGLKRLGGAQTGDMGDPAGRAARQRERLRIKLAQRRAEKLRK
jgi:hypothetical protein